MSKQCEDCQNQNQTPNGEATDGQAILMLMVAVVIVIFLGGII